MGYEQEEGIEFFSARNLSAGWFPGKEHNEIPGDIRNPSQAIGAFDADHVVWSEGALRKTFGFNNVNTNALESGATLTGMISMTSQSDNLVGTVGTKLYRNLHGATPTDITGSLTITAGLQVDFQEYRIGSTTMVIGVNGTDAPFKWEGSGNGALLGGSPPTCRWVEYFNNYIFLARTSTNPERLYFSGLSDPESWDTTNDFFTFDDEITGIKTFNKMLVVFKQKSIGIISGFGRQTWAQTTEYIKGVGCAGGHTIVNARIGGDTQADVIVFLADDGIYAFDGSPNIIKLSHPIQRKFIATSSASRFNESRFDNAVATHSDKWDWYILSLSDGGDSTNDFMVILDLARPGKTPDGMLYVPHWPVDGIDANIIGTRKVSGSDEIYFGGTDGFMYLFDQSLFNENGSSYDGYFTSKTFDLISTYILREANLMGDEIGNTNITLAVNMDLQTGDGESDTVNMNETGALFDSTFIIGTSTFGGLDFVYGPADINHVGRFMRFKANQASLDQRMIIEQIDFVMKNDGLRPNVAQI